MMLEFESFSEFCNFWKEFGSKEGFSMEEAAELFFDTENEVEISDQLNFYTA